MESEKNSIDWTQNCGWSYDLLPYELLRRENLNIFIYLLLWDRLGCLEVFNWEEKEHFFSLIFITINFQEISDVISVLKFLPVPIWSHKQQLYVSNQNRISMALKISKYSFSVRKYIQFFISAPIEKRLLLMLSE